VTEMGRLIHETSALAELQLLRAARAELPPAEARERLVALLEGGDEAEIDQALLSARGSVDVDGSPGVPDSYEAHSGMLDSALAALRAWTGRLAMRPALAGVAFGLVVGVGATALVLSLAWQPEVAVVPVGGERLPIPGAASQPAASAATSPSLAGATPSVDHVEEKKPTRAPASRRSGERTPPAPPTDQSVGSEVGLLDEVRRALSSGDTKTALSTLDRHSERFRVGVLQPEAAALRIQALVAAGNHAQAEAQAERFLSQYPDSPHARRVRALLAKAKARQKAPASSDAGVLDER